MDSPKRPPGTPAQPAQPASPSRPASKDAKVRVIDSLWTFFVALAVIGPFALPLLWRNPRFTRQTKIVGSIAIILFTIFLMWVTGKSLSTMWDQIKQIRAMLNGGGAPGAVQLIDP